MRILGIDPGIARMGWAVIDEENGKIRPVAFDCFQTPKEQEISTRLLAIYQTAEKLFTAYKPNELAIEELFFNTNAKTAFAVGQARGVTILAAATHQVAVLFYTPLQVKSAIIGYGRAEKRQIGEMVKTLLGLEKVPKPDDTADALAIALTHAYSRKMGMVAGRR